VILLGGVRTVAEGVRTDNCEISFPNLLEILSWIEPCCPSVRMVALQLHVISKLRLESPDHEDWRPDGCTLYAWLALSKIASRREHISSGWLQLSSHICVLQRSLAVLLRHPDGCNQEQFEGSRHRGRSGRKVLVVRTEVAWTVERPDKISRHPDGCKGYNFSDLESVQNLLETKHWNEDSENNWAPVKKHRYMEVILSKKMQPITNQHKLPCWYLNREVSAFELMNPSARRLLLSRENQAREACLSP